MSYKKTWASYLLWAVYTCAVGIMLANYAILFWQKEINAAVSYHTAVFVAAVFIGLTLCYFFIRNFLMQNFLTRDSLRHIRRFPHFWEGVIAFLIFLGALAYRVFLYLQTDMDAVTLTNYYDYAALKAEESAEAMLHGASYLYTICLSFVFSFLGNKAAAAVWMQILIQMLTILLAFFTVREIAGSIPACVMMAVLSFFDIYVGQIFDITPKDFSFFLYLIGLFLIGGCMKAYCKRLMSVRMMIFEAIFTGIGVGILIYLDAASITLLIFLTGFFTDICEKAWGRRPPMSISTSLFTLVIASGGLTFMGLLITDASSCGLTIGETAMAQYMLYRDNLSTDYVFYRTQSSLLVCSILVMFAALIIPAFWNRRKEQNVTPWICLMLILAPTPLTAAGVLSSQIYAIFIWSVLAGLGLQQTLAREPAPVVPAALTPAVAADAVMPGTSMPAMTALVSKQIGQLSLEEGGAPKPTYAPTADDIASAPKPRFIENPLPLPKKHERREMGYQYDEIAEDKMKYDIEVSEDDDFDHP